MDELGGGVSFMERMRKSFSLHFAMRENTSISVLDFYSFRGIVEKEAAPVLIILIWGKKYKK